MHLRSGPVQAAAPFLHLRAMGVSLTLHIEDSLLRHIVQDLFQDLTQAEPAGALHVRVTVEGNGPYVLASPRRASSVLSAIDVLGEVLAAVNVNLVEHSPLLTLHAAVLTRRGRTLVLPATSGTGKSTLCAALLQRGWAYVSDEALALDWGPGVQPYARPLALSPWSVAALNAPIGRRAASEHVLRASDLGAPVDTDPGPVTDVILLRRDALALPPRLAPASRSELVMALLQRGFTHTLDLQKALAELSSVVRSADVSVLHVGDPGLTADLLTDALA